jgi:hypothetical protein
MTKLEKRTARTERRNDRNRRRHIAEVLVTHHLMSPGSMTPEQVEALVVEYSALTRSIVDAEVVEEVTK